MNSVVSSSHGSNGPPAKSNSGSKSSHWVLIATVLGSSMEFIDGTVVNVALPKLQSSFGVSGTQAQWVVESYSLFLSALLLAGGSLGDRLGLKRTFMAGILIFACASVWCGLAPDFAQLLFARSCQGIGGALLVPNSLALLNASFSGEQRGRAIGTWAGFASMMTALGPVLGGWLVQHGSWRWVFLLNVPIAVTAIAITMLKAPSDPVRNRTESLDWRGVLLATAGLSAITFSLMEWEADIPHVRLIVVAGAVLLGVFFMVERGAESPMMPLDLFDSQNFAGANLLTFFLYAALSGALFYLPLNLIQIQRYSPTHAGAAMLPLVVLMSLLSRWAGGLTTRFGARLPLIVGPLITAGGYFLLGRPGVGGSYWDNYFPAMLVLGLGMTISVAPLTTAVMSSVKQERSGAASGFNNAVAQVAALLALAVNGPLFYAKFSTDLPRELSTETVSPRVIARIEPQIRRLGAIEIDDSRGVKAIDEAFISAFRLVTLLASGSALAAGLTAVLMIRRSERGPEKGHHSGTDR